MNPQALISEILDTPGEELGEKERKQKVEEATKVIEQKQETEQWLGFTTTQEKLNKIQIDNNKLHNAICGMVHNAAISDSQLRLFLASYTARQEVLKELTTYES